MAGNKSDKRIESQRLKGMKPGDRLVESFPGKGRGSLIFVCQKTGVITAKYAYHIERLRKTVNIDNYDPSGKAGSSLAQIREKGAEYSALHVRVGDLKQHFDGIASLAKDEEKAAQIREDQQSKIGSFQELLDEYVRDLTARGKTKDKEVQRLFRTHISDHHPGLMAKPAIKITPEDCHQILSEIRDRKPRGRGIGNKAKASPNSDMRSTVATVHRYLKAAFNFAAGAHLALERDVSATKIFAIAKNPAEAIRPLTDTEGGETESLSDVEFAEVLRYFASMPGALDAAICRSMIYFGGQRLAQILRVTWTDVSDDNSIRILETKGKRIAAWEHVLPVTPRALEIMKPLMMAKIGPGPFCLGEKLLRPDVLGKRFSDAGKALSEVGKTKYFTYRNIRVTCETMMAGLGITKEIRAWILSHGRRDVQGVHYDRYEYYEEKLNALILWGTYLDSLECGHAWSGNKIVLRKKRN